MFDLGWSELLVIGVVALIVVGPKDLPVLFRRAGEFVGKARGMAREFSRAMNEAADEAGVSDLKKTIHTASNPMKSAMDGVKDAARQMADPLGDLENGKKKGTSGSKVEDPEAAAKRAEQTKKIQAATARAAAERKRREADEAIKAAEAAEAAVDTPAATTPAQETKDL